MRTKTRPKTSISQSKWGVHKSHCCKKHGCKYGDEDCPVVLKLTKQKYVCEDGYNFGEYCFEVEESWKTIFAKYKNLTYHPTKTYPPTMVGIIRWLKKNYSTPTKKKV